MKNCKEETSINEEKKKQYRKNICVACGKEFMAPGRNKYCSKECKASMQSTTSTHEIVCKNCGKTVTVYKNAKFCGDECRIYYKNRQAALRKQNNRNETLTGTEDVDYVTCKICGIKAKQLGDAHFKVFHNSSLSKYRKLYPDAKITSQVFKDDNLIGANNPGSKEKTTEQERKERSPFSAEFYKKRGIDDTTRKEFIDNIAANRDYTVRLDYYINKGYTEEEAEKMLHERQVTFTLEKCIMKYGEEEGRRRFEERQKNWAAKMREKYENGEYSKVPYKLTSNMCSIFEKGCIDKIIKSMSETTENCNTEDFVKQFEIFVKGLHRRFIYDLKYKNKIIEFNGDYWHCNPETYDADYFNTQLQMTAKEKWEFDKVKEDIAALNGYTILVVWESEYKKDPEAVMQKCISFLASR